MATISQMTFSNAFLSMKKMYFDSNFTEVCSKGSNWQKVNIGSSNGMALNRRQAITWTNADPVHRRIYAALGWGELILGQFDWPNRGE